MSHEHRVLIVDDEERLRALLTRALPPQGLAVLSARDSREALAQLSNERVDLVLLDLVLGRENGVHLLAEIRNRWPSLPVIIVSGVTDIGVRVQTLERGAIDVVAKPSNLRELTARIHRHIPQPAASDRERYLEAGGLRLDLARRIVQGPQGRTTLAEREVALLGHLMRHSGDVCTRESLLRQVWELEFDPGSNLVDVGVRRLRLKVAGLRVEAVRGVGYCLVDS